MFQNFIPLIKILYYCHFRLDLDEWINEPPSESSDTEPEEDEVPRRSLFMSAAGDADANNTSGYQGSSKSVELTPDEMDKVSIKLN